VKSSSEITSSEQATKLDQGLLPDKRRSRILQEINNLGHISVEKIIHDYNVSKMTAWRDLKMLDDEGKVKKVFGGAVSCNSTITQEPHFDTKIASPEKIAIAKYATRFVHDDDVILLDGGTTPMEMIPFLSQNKLTIITNSLNSLLLASKYHKEFTIIGIGGLVRDVSMTCVGPNAEEQVRRINADTVFLSGIGLTLEHGLTEPSPLEVGVKRAMCNAAPKHVVLVEASKLNNASFNVVIQSDEIDFLVTDDRAPESFVKGFENIGVDVRVVAP
jgi:DeoR family myo-inositol catabolism operon transcriptional repressor